ncbi:DUF6745 domain-containing protein [Actinoplanes sp. NPDC026623]|uniref:DUF6745 domain-containing protein n=1 Tax=Actinoplanes sp. NPDC026623 TaxID=3155610 RepID=UPI0033D2AE15
MTAPTRRRVAADLDYWHRAVDIRREWRDFGLATEPADRDAAEETLTRLYRRHGRDRPRFAWVGSPRDAMPLVAGVPSHDDLQRWLRPRRPPGRPPLAGDIAAGWSRLRAALDEGADPRLGPLRQPGKDAKPWPVLPPPNALDAGVPLGEVLRQGVRGALRTILMDSIVLPVRATLAAPGRFPVAWWGQQDAYWIGHYDVLRRLGLAQHGPVVNNRLDDWATLARSCGWWWPGEEVCVVTERPARIEPIPLPDDNLPQPAQPAITYRNT